MEGFHRDSHYYRQMTRHWHFVLGGCRLHPLTYTGYWYYHILRLKQLDHVMIKDYKIFVRKRHLSYFSIKYFEESASFKISPIKFFHYCIKMKYWGGVNVSDWQNHQYLIHHINVCITALHHVLPNDILANISSCII